MSELVQIELTTPVVQEATAEATYDKLWMKNLTVMSPGPNRKIMLDSTLVACRDTADGKVLKQPESRYNIRVPDVFELLEDETISVETRTAIGGATNYLLTALTMYGKEKGVI